MFSVNFVIYFLAGFGALAFCMMLAIIVILLLKPLGGKMQGIIFVYMELVQRHRFIQLYDAFFKPLDDDEGVLRDREKEIWKMSYNRIKEELEYQNTQITHTNMAATEEATNQQRGGGIVNYFQGATINNLVINGNMTKNGDEHYHEAQQDKTERTISADTVTRALRECKAYVWGNAAYAVVFCICRERYGWQDNASLFERTLEQQGISLPEGTLNSAMSRNPYLRLPMDKWEASGAMERVVRLRDEFVAQVEKLLMPQEKSA